MSRDRQGTHPGARPGSRSLIGDGRVTVKGPRGTLARVLPGEITVRQEDSILMVERPNDERQNRALHGLTRSLVNNMVARRDRRLHQGPRDRRRRLPGHGQGTGSDSSWPSASATRSSSTPPRASPSRSRPPPASASRASTRNWSARWPPTSARSASPSPTRARASATPASASSARPARPPSKGTEIMTLSTKDKQLGRTRRHHRVRKKVERHARPGPAWPCSAPTSTSPPR